MATSPNKTIQTALVAWQNIASAAQVISAAFDVSAKWAVAIGIILARQTGSAFTAGWPNVRIEARNAASGQWIPLYSYQMQLGSSIAATTLNGAVSANAASFVVTAATNIAAGDLLFLGDASSANFEVVRVKSVSGTTITPEENVVFAHANGAVVTDQAEELWVSLDISMFTSLRAVVDNVGSGQGIVAQVTLITEDSFG